MWFGRVRDTIGATNQTKEVEMSNVQVPAVPVLIVAPPSRLRAGLHAIVRDVTQAENIEQVDQVPVVLQILQQHPQTLVILDIDLPNNGAVTLLKQIKSRWPHIRCVLLVNHFKDRACACGTAADAVLVKGFSTTVFMETIEKLLHQPTGQSR